MTGFDEKAERCLSLALLAAEKTGVSTRGGNLRFPLSAQRAITDTEIEDYCSRWVARITPAPGIEVGWRPRVEPTDLTVIQMLSKDLLQCQGRVETVAALAPIAAGLACGVPPQIALACPSSAPFWDWCEKHRLLVGERPITALCVPVDTKKKHLSYHDASATTSFSVAEYTQVQYSDALRAQCAAAVAQLEECELPNLLRPSSLAEANQLMDASMSVIYRNYDGHFYMHAELANGAKITTGQLLHYCQQIWPDSELYHLATRWRPSYMPKAKTASKDGEKRGGIYIPDKANNRVSIMGSPSICQGLAPILAAIRIRMAPEMARKTHLFESVFFEFMDWDVRRDKPAPTTVTDIPRFANGEVFDARFAHEELMMGRALRILMGTYNESQGQYQGITCFPGVSWSREDFVANLLLWWPHADIQQGPKFRYVPHFMEKGGLELEDGGKYISQQGKASSQGVLMILAASLACGIPAPIAALLKSSDQFWAFIAVLNGAEAVEANRRRLREVRDARFGEEWHKVRGTMQLEESDLHAWQVDQRRSGDIAIVDSKAVCWTRTGRNKDESASNGPYIGASHWGHSQRSNWGNTDKSGTANWGKGAYHSGASNWGNADKAETSNWGRAEYQSEPSNWGKGAYHSGASNWVNVDKSETSNWGNTDKSETSNWGRAEYQSGASNWGKGEWSNWGNDEQPYQHKSRNSNWDKSDRQWDHWGQASRGNVNQNDHSGHWGQTSRGDVTQNDYSGHWGKSSRGDANSNHPQSYASRHDDNLDKNRSGNGHSNESWGKSGNNAPKTLVPPVSLDTLMNDFEFSGSVWTQVRLPQPQAAWQCAALLFGFGAAAVGTCVPAWSLRATGKALVCECVSVAPNLEIHFVPNEAGLFTTVGLLNPANDHVPKGAFGLISLLAGLGSGLAPNRAINTPELKMWVDLLADKFLGDVLDLHAIFSAIEISKLRPDPVEYVYAKSLSLMRPVNGWPVGTVLRVDWEVEEAFFCSYLGSGTWIDKTCFS